MLNESLFIINICNVVITEFLISLSRKRKTNRQTDKEIDTSAMCYLKLTINSAGWLKAVQHQKKHVKHWVSCILNIAHVMYKFYANISCKKIESFQFTNSIICTGPIKTKTKVVLQLLMEIPNSGTPRCYEYFSSCRQFKTVTLFHDKKKAVVVFHVPKWPKSGKKL